MVCEIVYTGHGAPPGSCMTKRGFVRTMNKHFAKDSMCNTPSQDCVNKWLDFSGALPAKTLPLCKP